jgi:hypothetical protein
MSREEPACVGKDPKFSGANFFALDPIQRGREVSADVGKHAKPAGSNFFAADPIRRDRECHEAFGRDCSRQGVGGRDAEDPRGSPSSLKPRLYAHNELRFGGNGGR